MRVCCHLWSYIIVNWILRGQKKTSEVPLCSRILWCAFFTVFYVIYTTWIRAFYCSLFVQLQVPCTKAPPLQLLRKRKAFLIHFPLLHSKGLGFKLVTFRPTVAWAWVAALSLNTHCEAIEHNETACTQALSDDMPSMRQPNLHPLLPYEMHLLYVIMLFEAHRQQDISSTSVFGQLIPSVHSTARGVIGSLHTGKRPLWRLLTTPEDF